MTTEEQINNLTKQVNDLTILVNGLTRKEQNQLVSYLPKGANFILSQVESSAKGASPSFEKDFYVSLTSAGAVTTKLSFRNGILIRVT